MGSKPMAEANPHAAGREPAASRESTSLTLLEKLRQNQEDAWVRLGRLYGPLIHSWCARWGFSPPDIEDICQEVYQVVVKRIGEFHRDGPGDTFRGWLRGITRNRLLF